MTDPKDHGLGEMAERDRHLVEEAAHDVEQARTAEAMEDSQRRLYESVQRDQAREPAERARDIQPPDV